MDNVLIIGSSGKVGRKFLNSLKGQCVGTYYSHPMVGCLKCDPLSDDINTIIREYGPFSHALILYGLTRPDSCIMNPEQSHKVNVDSVKKNIDILIANGVTPVYFSSEVVFNGEKGNYSENDPVDPLMLYGKQKVAIETYCKDAYPDSTLVVRLGRVIFSDTNIPSLFNRWILKIKKGETILCASDHIFSPIMAEDAVASVNELMRVNEKGLVHVAGSESCTRLEMLNHLTVKMKSLYGLEPTVRSCKMKDFDTIEKRPLNVSLNISSLIKKTEFIPRGIRHIVDACLAG